MALAELVLMISFCRVWIEGLSAVGLVMEVPVVVVPVIPAMVVCYAAAIAIPVAFEELLSIVMRFHPACAGVGWAGPVSVVPLVLAAHRIPVAPDPNIAGTGTSWLNPNDTRMWRRADSHSDRDLSEYGSRG
jgi:hypothetical protein